MRTEARHFEECRQQAPLLLYRAGGRETRVRLPGINSEVLPNYGHLAGKLPDWLRQQRGVVESGRHVRVNASVLHDCGAVSSTDLRFCLRAHDIECFPGRSCDYHFRGFRSRRWWRQAAATIQQQHSAPSFCCCCSSIGIAHARAANSTSVP